MKDSFRPALSRCDDRYWLIHQLVDYTVRILISMSSLYTPWINDTLILPSTSFVPVNIFYVSFNDSLREPEVDPANSKRHGLS